MKEGWKTQMRREAAWEQAKEDEEKAKAEGKDVKDTVNQGAGTPAGVRNLGPEDSGWDTLD